MKLILINKFVLKSVPIYVFKGAVTIAYIPLLLVIYAISPFIKFRFGYISVDRIGHFAMDLAHIIAINKDKDKNTVNLYYLQGLISNKQLETIAKRELNVYQICKYFVYAYELIGLGSKVLLPNRHTNGSVNIDGATYHSKYDILLTSSENKVAKSYMSRYGWTEGEKFVCLNVRDKAFFSDSETSRHAYRNSDIHDFEVAINYLLNLGYWVVRMGKKVEKPLGIKHDKLIDYGIDPNRSDLLDIWFCKNCDFFISTGTGIDAVALMFKKQTLIANLLPIMDIIGWINGITVPKRLFWNNGKELSLTEHLNNYYQDINIYKEKKIDIVSLTPDEIKSVVQEMVDRLNDMPLSDKQIQDQGKFWNILEHHESYGKFHGVRDPDASFGTSFLKNNPNFLS